ncbi:hypothetical protein M9Y10_041423 [Tritrichomonas musculus]|uniref:Uncharacterized protein n=1 Tax=Tritrichomonas musculus TaxID=1915356 RepID=A0ABR2K4F5_9EUKA
MGFFTTVFIYFIVLAVILLLLLFWPESDNHAEKSSKQNEVANNNQVSEQKDTLENPQQVEVAEREVNIEDQQKAEENNQQNDQDNDQANEQDNNQENEEEPELRDRSASFIEFPEQPLEEDAPEEVKEEHAWNHNVRQITKTINNISKGNLKAINFCYVDRLINVRGKSRPIAFFLRPVSSELAPSGVFIYDTTRVLKDNALYLFVGPEADEFQEKLGEKLLDLMIESTKCPNIIRINRDMNSPDFQRMIHQMGGNKIMMQTPKNYGDQLFFEIQFFKTLLHIEVFEGEMMTGQDNLDFDELPPNCAVVIDTSDNALYLYVDHVDPQTEDEKKTQLNAIEWMSEQPEFAKRELLVFDKSKIPPNLKLLFCTEQ